MQSRRPSPSTRRVVLVFALIAICATAQRLAGQASNRSETPEESVRELQDQLRMLNSTVREMRDEVKRSRAEVIELRRDLESTREQLVSFKRQLGPGNVPTPDPEPGALIPTSATRNVAVSAYTAPGQRAGAADTSGTEGLAPPSASDNATANADDRLSKLEEDQRLLEAKVNEQNQTKVESGSKYRVRLSGIALLNVFDTRGSVDNIDLPDYARARGPFDSGGSFDATVRQSELGLEVFGPTLGGARTSGDIQFDFFGGFPDVPDGVAAGLARMRTARIRFDWANTSVVAGQDTPFFSPLSPTSLASLGVPALSYAGNLWVWTPQVRVEHRVNLSDASNILLQGGILDSLTGQTPADSYYRAPSAGENSRQPAYAARIAWTRHVFGEPLTIGAGGYYARQKWVFGRTVDAWAGTGDWDLPLSHGLSLEGEFYRGRGIAGLGGGLGPSALYGSSAAGARASVRGLDSVGGWSQLKFKPSERIEFNGAFGEDYPFASELARYTEALSYGYGSSGRNQSGFVNAIYHARSNMLFSLEYRRLWTSNIPASKYTADDISGSIGVLF